MQHLAIIGYFFFGWLPLLIYYYGIITLFAIHRERFGYIFVPEIKI